MPTASSPEQPMPVRQVSRMLGEWIGRLGEVWVEGEVAQLNRRPGARFIFLTLRDTEANISLQVTCGVEVLNAVQPPLTEGARVVVLGRPSWYAGRGSLSLAVRRIQPVGIGELLARLETLRITLAAEGLFAESRKRPLPFLPRTIGLISGRAAAAERDVVENTKRRWPGARFLIENTAVQGAAAVPEITAALARLCRQEAVDVIVIARGGGSVEDLLPFSDEALLRAVSACSIPVVSAIGHEQDSPLLDLVADVRGSTPTDAARRIVPDFHEEALGLRRARQQAHRMLSHRIQREQQRLHALIAHPVLASSGSYLQLQRDQITGLRARGHASAVRFVERASDRLDHRCQQLRLLSPGATLDRGYAIVHKADGHVLRHQAEASHGQPITIRLSDGVLAATLADPSVPPKVSS